MVTYEGGRWGSGDEEWRLSCLVLTNDGDGWRVENEGEGYELW